MPGFEPYLAFLRDDVFLKFNSRGYQDPNEKVDLFLLTFKDMKLRGMSQPTIITVKPPVNDHPKCKDLVDAYRRCM